MGNHWDEGSLKQVKPDASKLKLVYYSTTTPELREKLWHLKLGYGYFRRVLKEEELYNTLQVIAATGPRGGIYGWAGIYVSTDYSLDPLPETWVGVYVAEEYRHQGLGGKLRSEAFKICIAQGTGYAWQDRKENRWVRVGKDGTERRTFSFFG
jgi:GNAT superfamily N-acetyltransferase